MTGLEHIAALKLSRPELAIEVNRLLDEHHKWEGDGPDPANEGYIPYMVRVRAFVIRNGELVAGMDTLSGCYYKPGEPIGDVHGYLFQMVDEAIADLDRELAK